MSRGKVGKREGEGRGREGVKEGSPPVLSEAGPWQGGHSR